jgi:hypothetical protein
MRDGKWTRRVNDKHSAMMSVAPKDMLFLVLFRAIQYEREETHLCRINPFKRLLDGRKKFGIVILLSECSCYTTCTKGLGER